MLHPFPNNKLEPSQAHCCVTLALISAVAKAGDSERAVPAVPRAGVRLFLGLLRGADRDGHAGRAALPDDLPHRVDLHDGNAGRGAATGGLLYRGLPSPLRYLHV